MKTAFIIEPPYSLLWKKGYLVTNPENRRTVILYNNDRNRSSVSYSRYLMSVSLGRMLDKNEHVDHIDEDKTNDILNNLQILTPVENTKKSAVGETFFDLICRWCGNTFKREARQMHKKWKTAPCCSRSCSGKLQHTVI